MTRHHVISRFFQVLGLLMAVGLVISAWRIHAAQSAAALGLALSGLCVVAISAELFVGDWRAGRRRR